MNFTSPRISVSIPFAFLFTKTNYECIQTGQTRSSLLSLPTELRCEIYRYDFDSVSLPNNIACHRRQVMEDGQALLPTCCQTRHEASAYLGTYIHLERQDYLALGPVCGIVGDGNAELFKSLARFLTWRRLEVSSRGSFISMSKQQLSGSTATIIDGRGGRPYAERGVRQAETYFRAQPLGGLHQALNNGRRQQKRPGSSNRHVPILSSSMSRGPPVFVCE